MSIRMELTSSIPDAEVLKRINQGDVEDKLQAIGRIIEAISVRGGKVVYRSVDTAASGTLTLASSIADDTFVIGNITFTGKASPSGAVQYLVGASDDATRDNIIAKVNAHSSLSGVVVASIGGVAASGTLTCASVVADNTFVIDGTTFTIKAAPASSVQVKLETTDTKQANTIAAAINGNDTTKAKVIATSSGGVVTITSLNKGTLGNALTLAGTTTTLAASGTKLTSGTCLVKLSTVDGGIAGNLIPLAGTALKLVASGSFLTGGASTSVTLNKGV